MPHARVRAATQQPAKGFFVPSMPSTDTVPTGYFHQNRGDCVISLRKRDRSAEAQAPPSIPHQESLFPHRSRPGSLSQNATNISLSSVGDFQGTPVMHESATAQPVIPNVLPGGLGTSRSLPRTASAPYVCPFLAFLYLRLGFVRYVFPVTYMECPGREIVSKLAQAVFSPAISPHKSYLHCLHSRPFPGCPVSPREEGRTGIIRILVYQSCPSTSAVEAEASLSASASSAPLLVWWGGVSDLCTSALARIGLVALRMVARAVRRTVALL